MKAAFISVLIITASSAAMAEEPQTSEHVPTTPMTVSSPDLVDAAQEACSLDMLRQQTGGGIERLLQRDKTKVRVFEDKWLERYNAFANSLSADLLRREAENLYKNNAERYTDEQCNTLVPLYGLAYSASTIEFSETPVSAGKLLETCGDALCIPESIERIKAACEIDGDAGRYHDACFGLEHPALTPFKFSNIKPPETTYSVDPKDLEKSLPEGIRPAAPTNEPF